MKATASSAQKPWTSYTFGPENLVDRDLQTSWQPEKKKGVGASFEIVLPREVVVAEIHIANGFQRRDGLGDLLRMNGVAGHVQVEIGTERLAFEMAYDRGDIGERYPYRDGMYQLWGWTPLKVPPSKTAQFKVTALSVTPGLVWDDLAISEVRVFACREAQP